MIINKEAAIIIAKQRSAEREENIDVYCVSGHTFDMYLLLPVYEKPVNEHAQYIQRVFYE